MKYSRYEWNVIHTMKLFVIWLKYISYDETIHTLYNTPLWDGICMGVWTIWWICQWHTWNLHHMTKMFVTYLKYPPHENHMNISNQTLVVIFGGPNKEVTGSPHKTPKHPLEELTSSYTSGSYISSSIHCRKSRSSAEIQHQEISMLKCSFFTSLQRGQHRQHN